MKRDATWPLLSDYCRLKNFTKPAAQKWEDYLQQQREYWGADRISGPNSDIWEWKGSEKRWLELEKANFQSYLDDVSRWNGLFHIGDRIALVKTDLKNVIKLCRETDGKTTWGETLELWLSQEIGFFPPKRSLMCDVIGFGTAVDSAGDPTWSRKRGTYLVHIDAVSKVLVVGDALFDLLD